MMRLTDEFTISTPPDRAFAMLLDLERVAPCIPGGEIDAPDAAGVYPGRVSVKLGPMKFVYTGKVRFTEQDQVERTAVIEGEGRAATGADTARVRSVMEVLPAGDGSRVRITTDLDIKGRAAQMGQGVIVDVSRRLVSQAAACIEARLSAPDDAPVESLPSAGPVGGISLMASVMGSRIRGLATRRGTQGDANVPSGPDDSRDGHAGASEETNDGTR
jgi:carbon monoxide dehydrogenase subunit G